MDQGDLRVNIVELSRLHVVDANNEMVSMHSLWKDQTAIFIFLRHFACVECRAFAKEFWQKSKALESKGAKLYFIGNGDPTYINYFKEELEIQEAPIYTDPSLHVFRAAGFKRGFLVALGPRSILKGRQLFQEGHAQGKYKKEMGDLWQMGGALVIKPDGRVTYKFVSQKLGDYAPETDLIGNS